MLLVVSQFLFFNHMSNDVVEKAPWELQGLVSIYLFYDRARKIYINPVAIDTKAHAIELFGQLLETENTYAYKGYHRFDLYKLCAYSLKTGKTYQKRGVPSLVVRGTRFLPNRGKTHEISH